MTKKGKRTALLQYHERIAELERENEALKDTMAAGRRPAAEPHADREPPQAAAGPDPDAFTICDARLNVIDVDEAALRYFRQGLRREDVIGKNLADLLPDGERCSRYRRVLETGERSTAEETVALPAGGEAHVVTRAFRVGDRLAILITDITARSRVDAALRASDKISRAIQDNINEGVLVIQDGLIKLARFRGGASIRATSGDVLGRPFLDSVHPEDRQMVLDHYSRRQKGEDAPRRYQLRFLDTDGGVHWIEVRATLLEWEGRPATLALLTQVDDRRDAEMALKSSEEKYRLLIEKTNDVIWTAGLDLVLTYVSPSVERALGFTPEEHLRRPLSEQLTPDSLARAHDALQRHLEMESHGRADPERTLRIELEHYRRDGTAVWMEQHISGLRDASGILTGIHGVARDISQQKKAQEALEESEAKYRALAEESIQGLVLASGMPPRVLYCNTALARMIGYTSEEIEAMPPEEYANLIHPDDREALVQHHSDRLSGRAAAPRLQYRGLHRDGRVVWIEMASALVQYEGEAAVQASLIDITDRKQAEETLRASEERYRQLVEHANEGIAVLQDGVMKYVNPQMAEVAGYTAEEMLSQSFLDFTHPDDRSMAIDYYVRRQRGEDIPSRYQFRFLHKDGTTGWAEMSATLFEWDGRMASLAMINDITERVKAEQALADSEAKYRLLVDNANQGIILVQDELVAFANPTLARMTGYAIEELLSRPFLDLLHPDDRDTVRGYYLRRITGEEFPHVYPVRLVDREGNARWAEINAVMVGWQGRPAVLSLVTDISERRQAQEALAASEAKYRDLFEHTMLGMEVVDAKTARVVLANRSLARIFGFRSPGDMVGVDALDYILPEDRDLVVQQIAQLLQDPSWDRVATIRARTVDGRLTWVTGMATQFEYEGQPAMLISLLDATAAKESEIKLQEREEQYRLLVENATEAIAVLQDGRIRFGNRKFIRVSGYSPDEFLGAPSFLDFVHPDDRERLADYYFNRLSGREVPDTYQFRFVNKAGEVGWSEVNVTLLPWEGKPATLCLMDIITERKQAEESARRKTEELDGFFNVALDLLCIADADARFHLLNVAWERTLGWTRQELMEGRFFDFVHPDDVKSTEGAMALLASGEGVINFVNRYRCRDGSYRWLEWRSAPAGRLIYAAASDITDRREAEESLKASEEKHRLLTEKMNDVVWTMDMGLRLTYLSPSAEKLFGYAPEELVGQSAELQVTPETFALASRLLQEQVELEQDPRADPQRAARFEAEYIRKDGSTVWMEVVVSGLRDASGTLIGVHGVSRDITERRRARETLLASEEKYRLLTEKTNDVIWTTNMDLRTTYLSPSAERVFGFKPEERLGMTAAEQMTPDSFARAQEMMLEQMELENEGTADPQRTLSIELEYYRKDGSTVWMEALVGGIRDASGRLIGAHGVSRDISERRKAQETLRASEEKYRGIFDENIVTIYVFDQDKRFLDTNQAGCDLLGYTREELLGRRIADVDADPVAVLPSHAELLDGGRLINLEHRLRRRDGTIITVLNNSRPLTDAGGHVIGMQSTLLDITQRRATEDALRESEQRYRLLAENATDIIWTTDAGLNVTYVSPSVTRLMGYAVEEITRGPLDRLLTPTSLAYISQVHEDSLAEEEQTAGTMRERAVEVEMVRRDGSILWLEAAINVLRDGDGRFAGFQGACRDISGRRQAEETLRASEERNRMLVENANEAVTVLQDGVIMFGNPKLDAISGYAAEELLLKPFLEMVHPDDRGMVMDAFYRTQEEDIPSTLEFRLLDKAGNTRWVQMNAALILWEGSLAVLALFADITERKKAEEALRLSEDRFRTIFEKSPIGAIVYDADGRATNVNEACAVMFGLPNRESIRSVSLFNDPYIADAAKQRLRAGQSITGEAPVDLGLARERGEYSIGRSGMAHIRLIVTPLGREGGFLGLVEDITERKKAEAELRHSEERLSLALESASAGMFDWNMITGEMHFSDRFYTMLGYDPGEFPATYESFESLWHPDERMGLDRVIDNYRQNRTDHHEIEMRLRTKSGDWRWVASHGRMVLSWGQDMKPSRLVGAQFDITQRKEMQEQILRAHAELEARVEQRTGELKEANRLLIEEIRQRQQAQKRLQESESKYRELVENANSIIMELDTRGRVTFFNRFAEEFYGFKEAEIIGRHLVGTIAPPVDSAGKDVKAQTRDLVKHPEGYFVTENEGMRRNGDRVWISWTNKGLHDAEGHLRNILCIGMDRTEQRRVADMLAEQLKEKAAADERQRLARDLHDAVTQTLFSASLIAEVLPQLWRKDRGEADRRLEELRRLTRGALAEMRMLLLELRPGALGEVGLVELLRQLVEATAAQTKLRLELGFRGKCGVPAEVQVALYRVAQEALNNVVKHSGATEAEIRLNCRPGAADLTVSDNGAGFDPLEVSPKSLGLRIMHERVEAVGATLEIVGRAGGGTRVRAVWSHGRRKGDS